MSINSLNSFNKSNDLLRVSEAAARWWSTVIKNPKNYVGNEISDKHFANMRNSDIQPITEEDQERFFEVLKSKIYNKLVEGGFVWLRVDYDASGILRDSVIESGIPEDNLPLKTTMDVYKDQIVLSYGNGAPKDLVYVTLSHYENLLKHLESQLVKTNSSELVDNYETRENIKTIKDFISSLNGNDYVKEGFLNE